MKNRSILPWALVVILGAALIFVLIRQTQPAAVSQQPTSIPTTLEPGKTPPGETIPAPTSTTAPTVTDTRAASPSPLPTSEAGNPTAIEPPSTPSATTAPIAGVQPLAVPPIPVNIIDHRAAALFDQIPPEYLREAEKIRMVFFDRSVGWNISSGLDCLAAPSWAASPSHCRRYFTSQVVCAAPSDQVKTYTSRDAVIPAAIRFPGGNDRSNIEFVLSEGAYWYEELQYFLDRVPQYADRQIITYGHNYLQVTDSSDIADVYFDPNYDGPNLYELAALETKYPDKTFVYWTTSLARNIGTDVSRRFNEQMRDWAKANNRILFDLADILSHTTDGQACLSDNGNPVICCEYTTESEGGHLGAVSAGKLQAAKALWVMLAQLAGWQPNQP
ncbi:MAG: hypothetical protein KatS3mg045_0390 [Bellilinea sp.]|nr:MAG: hypothetical protein KatS3mg045_0390 [Bellilinea sp.]